MTELLAKGPVRKMKTRLADQVQYTAVLGEQQVELNQYLGQKLSLEFSLSLIHI